MKHSVYVAAERDRSGGWLLAAEIAGIAGGSAFGRALPVRIPEWVCPAVCGGTLWDVFTGTLLISALFLAAAFLLGLFALGQAPAAGLIFAAGGCFGAAAVWVYAENGAAAFPVVAALVLPKSLALSAVMLLAVREAWRSSGAILRGLASGGQEGGSLRLYCVKFIVLLNISLLISAADSLLNYVFAGLV